MTVLRGPLPWSGARAAASRLTMLTMPAKRALDVVAAGLLLVVLAPLLLAVLVAVRATSPGPGIFRQTRVGAGSAPFTLLKFRTMTHGCSEDTHRDYVRGMLEGRLAPTDGIFKLDGDPRVTRVGGWLRRTSIDELPQLVNVLRGDMSLVGPRPVLPFEAGLFPEWAVTRFAVRPGLTGLWQVSGRNRLTMQEGLALDKEYVERLGVLRDLRILARTVPALLRGGAR